MSNSVDKIIDDILRREGGYTNHPADKGGPTNFGVTQDTLSYWRGYDVSISEVKELQESEAREIYLEEYYLTPGFDHLVEELQPFIVDSAVNHGPKQATKFLQSACNRLVVLYTPLEVDGICGTKTSSTANHCVGKCGAAAVLSVLFVERFAFYLDLVKSKPSQLAFLHGWMNRLREFAG